MIGPYSVYLHIPFCVHRCSYCDFNTYAGQESLIPAYTRALCEEIRQVSEKAPGRLPVHTIFFGGGTPSLLDVDQMEMILGSLKEAFDWTQTAEVTIEANPGTVNPKQLRAFHALGINRISFGMQSANPEELKLLERQHDPLNVIQSVKFARQAGFDNLNLDLMFGLPGQSLERWQESLEFALRLGVEHLSLYALTLEKDTPFYHAMQRGQLPLIDNDLAADMYEHAQARLAAAGFRQYEISNWARVGSGGNLLACSHNLQYWRNRPYFGFGAGAHGYVAGVRTANVLGIRAYLQRLSQPDNQPYPLSQATIQDTRIGVEDEVKETMMMGLRLVEEGVSNLAFSQRFGFAIQDVYSKEIEDCIKYGLLEWSGREKDQLRLTSRGILLGNQVFSRFVVKDLVLPET